MAIRRAVLQFFAVAVPIAGVVALLIWLMRPAPPSRATAASPPSMPSRIRVVLDTSASMAGYFSGKTEFKDFLDTLVVDLPQQVSRVSRKLPTIDYALMNAADGSLEPYEGGSQRLLADLLTNSVPAGDSSMLQEVLRSLSTTIQRDEVDLLVTDGIFSFPDSAIRKDPDINVNNIEGLASQVQLVFQDARWQAKSMRPGLAIVQYLSSFRGTYFTLRNAKLSNCCPGLRPFYVWIIGDAKQVASTFAAVRRIAGPELRHAIFLGPMEMAPEPRILNYSNRTGTWTRQRGNRLSARQVPANGPADMTIALNLRDLPPDVVARDYVLTHLEVTSQFSSVVPTGFFTREQMKAKLDPHDEGDLEDATHFLALRVMGLNVKTATVSVTLRDELPRWCQDSSTLDDTQAASAGEPPRTFGLLPIVNGAARALRGTTPLFQFQLTMER